MEKKLNLRISAFLKRVYGYTASMLIQTALGLASVYIGLSQLSAETYGTYAIIFTIINLLASLAAGPVGFITAGKYLAMEKEEKNELSMTLLLVAAIVGASANVLFLILSHSIALVLKLNIDTYGLLFAGFSILPMTLVFFFTNLYYNQGNHERVLCATFIQGTGGLVILYWSLYIWHWSSVSLYFAQFVGAALAATACLIMCGKQFHFPNLRLLKDARALYGGHALNTFISNMPPLVENSIISFFTGTGAVAIWQHSRLYGNLLLKGIKILGLAVWPISLNEANSTQFFITHRIWNLIYILLTLSGVGAVFLVEPFISFLTHDKLNKAGFFVPWWVIYCLIQNMGREAEAVLYAADKGLRAAKAQTICRLVVLVLLVPLLVIFGLKGGMAAYLVEAILYRYFLRLNAKRVYDIPAIDSWAFVGSFIVFGTIGMEYTLEPLTLLSRIGLAMLGCAFTLFLARKELFAVLSLRESVITNLVPSSPKSSGDFV